MSHIDDDTASANVSGTSAPPDKIISKAVRLGPKISNKQSIDDKIYLLTHSHFLRKKSTIKFTLHQIELN